MRRFILIICLIFSCILFINECMHISDAEQAENILISEKQLPYPENYIPIPKELSKQYKAEMEQIIDEEYPKVIKKIDDYLKYVKTNYNEIIKNGCKTDYYLSPEVSIYDLDISLYNKLVKITQKKYLNIEYKSTGTDDNSSLEAYMYPYLIDNNVNINKLKKLGLYAKKKHKIVNRYNKKAQNYCHKNI